MKIQMSTAELIVSGTECELAQIHAVIVAFMIAKASPQYLFPQAIHEHLDCLPKWIEPDPVVLAKNIQSYSDYKNLPNAPRPQPTPLELKN